MKERVGEVVMELMVAACVCLTVVEAHRPHRRGEHLSFPPPSKSQLVDARLFLQKHPL
jgi:hypothetical protein